MTAVQVTPEQLGLHPGEEYEEGQLEFDLGNLLAIDPTPVEAGEDIDAACLSLATKLTQTLIGKLFKLPTEASDVGPLALLPPPTTLLPRAKPIPKPREPTKWEKFAKQKGIQKRKRSSLVYDEDNQEYRRRYGYKRAGDLSDVAIIEANKSTEGPEDPFTAQKKQKRERVKAQDKRQLDNLKATAKAGGAAALPSTLRLAASLPEHGKGRPVKRKELHDDIKAASRQAGVATASMGKFDKRLKGEKEGERRLPGKQRKFAPVADLTGAERQQQTSMVNKIMRERADDILDVSKAMGRMEADRRESRRQEKMQADGESTLTGTGMKKRGKMAGRRKHGQEATATQGGNRRKGSAGKSSKRISQGSSLRKGKGSAGSSRKRGKG